MFGLNYRFINVPENITSFWPEDVLNLMEYYSGNNASFFTNMSAPYNWSYSGNYPTMDYKLFIATKEFHNCITSAMTSRIIDYYLLYVSDPMSPVVPRLWLYDWWETIQAIYMTGRMLYYAGHYELAQFEAYVNESAFSLTTITFPNWFDWCYLEGLGNDIFTVRGGMWLTAFIDAMVYDKQNDILVSPNKTNNGLISMAMSFMKVLFGKNGIFGTTTGVYHAISNLLGNVTGTNSTNNLKRMMDPNEYSIKPFARRAFGSMFTNITQRLVNTSFYQKMEVTFSL